MGQTVVEEAQPPNAVKNKKKKKMMIMRSNPQDTIISVTWF